VPVPTEPTTTRLRCQLVAPSAALDSVVPDGTLELAEGLELAEAVAAGAVAAGAEGAGLVGRVNAWRCQRTLSVEVQMVAAVPWGVLTLPATSHVAAAPGGTSADSVLVAPPPSAGTISLAQV
jgi:hypothetical protein